MYNDNGCITSVKKYKNSTNVLNDTESFTYDSTHPDRLTSFDGTTIPYNAYGYPTKRGDHTLSWSKGRLAGASKGSIKTGGESYSYTYNALGQRIKKSYIKYPEVNTGTIQPVYKDMLTRSTTTYSYDNAGRLINEYVLETYSESGDVSREMTYLYDASGMIGFVERYNGTTKTYYYNRNLQGDVTEIYDNTGALKVTYRYDAWGNCTISGSDSGLGNRNKIRYRGYYFDKETEFYCLGARYYNSEWCRFISPDDTAYIDPQTPNGLNLYCYCGNDPVNFVDPTGHSWESFWNSTKGKILGSILVIGGMIALTVATAGIGTAVVGALGGGFWAAVAGGAVGGAISGAIFGTGMSMLSQGVTNGYDNIDYGQVAIDGLIGMASGAMTGAVFAAAGRGLGLLGKTKWAQRELMNFTRTSNNFMFGSDKSFTFMRFGHIFRLDASMKAGLHFHWYKSSAEHWELIFQIGNTVAGLLPTLIN